MIERRRSSNARRIAPPLHAVGQFVARARFAPIAVTFCAYLFLLPAGSLQAQVRVGDGLQVRVQTDWIDGQGYYPVRVTVTPTAAARFDRLLRLEFEPLASANQSGVVVASKDIVVPAGRGPATTILSVPKIAIWHAYNLYVYEAGEGELKKLRFEEQALSTQAPWAGGGWNMGWNQGNPTIVFVGDSSPDVTNLFEAYGQQVNGPNFQFQAGAGGANAGNKLTTVSRERLPENWLNYTALDVLVLSQGGLENLALEQPTRFAAMRTWVAAGGNLWIFGIGDQFDGAERIEQVLAMPSTKSPAGAEAGTKKAKSEYDARIGALQRRGWNEPRRQLRAEIERRREARRRNASQRRSDQENSGDEGAKSDLEIAETGEIEHVMHLHRELGLGRVAIFAPDDPFAETSLRWRRLLDAHENRLEWVQRHGVNSSRGNYDFATFLIPGVGEVPVTGFNILITLFVIAIGPVNYWFLRRRAKLHLLIVTAPLFAGLATISLITYAILADGFSIRARARSFTQIDQRSGEAVCWSRLSYYAGLAPSGGLVFSSDTMVMPLFPGESSGDGGPPKSTFWDDQQHLRSGWLRSRTPTQFVTVRVRTTENRLDVHEDDNAAPRVENRLGTRIDRLLLVGRDGKAYEASSIEPDAAMQLAPAQASQTLDEMRATMRGHRPRVPAGLVAGGGNPFNSMMYYGGYGQSPGDQVTGIMETSLGELESIMAAQLEPGTYIAIVERSPEMQFGLEGFVEEESFHVIYGKW